MNTVQLLSIHINITFFINDKQVLIKYWLQFLINIANKKYDSWYWLVISLNDFFFTKNVLSKHDNPNYMQAFALELKFFGVKLLLIIFSSTQSRYPHTGSPNLMYSRITNIYQKAPSCKTGYFDQG